MAQRSTVHRVQIELCRSEFWPRVQALYPQLTEDDGPFVWVIGYSSLSPARDPAEDYFKLAHEFSALGKKESSRRA